MPNTACVYFVLLILFKSNTCTIFKNDIKEAAVYNSKPAVFECYSPRTMSITAIVSHAEIHSKK